MSKFYDWSGEENIKKRTAPLSLAELRARLKHIEILCCGLSMDLSSEIERREFLEAQNKELKAQLSKYDKRIVAREELLAKLPEEERLAHEMALAKHRACQSGYSKAKAAKAFDDKH